VDFLPKHLRKNIIMNIIERTCATCAAFNPAPEGDDPACLNLTSIIEQYRTPKEFHREPLPNDYCDSHQTHEEDAAETREIELTRHLAQATPQFMNASRACLGLRDTLGEDHPETQKAVDLAMSLAPHSLTEYLATQKAAADKHEAELTLHRQEATPEFMAAMSACLALVESLGMEHPDTTRAMQRAMALAGPSMHDFMARQAKELDLIPEADGYLDDGEPVFSLESIAAKLGLGMEEAKEAMDVMLEDRAAQGLPAALVDPSKVHRKH
jgi:hypothetical protein